MADSTLNIVDPATRDAATTAGDVPDRVKRRYLTDDRNGPGLGFYVDASVSTPAFRDRGHRLSTDRNDPNVVRDLVAIAQHRGWTIIGVRGQTNFRREVWIAARAAGLEVRGYRPTERDVQDLARRTERRRDRSAAEAERAGSSVRHRADPGAATRMKVVEAVVKDRIVEPAAQARVIAAARGRIADWLERGAKFEDRRRDDPENRLRPERGR